MYGAEFDTERDSDPSSRARGLLPLIANPLSGSGFDYVATSTLRSDFGLNLIRETTAGANKEYVFGPSIDEPLAVYASGAVSYLNADGLGSVVATNGPTGTVTHGSVFDAWGVARSETGTRVHSFSYTGREVGEAGLLAYRVRLLDPARGRFGQEDRLRRSNVTGYSYADDDPLLLTDPTGLKAWGHHYFPRSVFRDIPGLSQEAFDAFMAASTGPIPGGHGWSKPHKLYNDAVKELFDEWIKATGRDPAKLTAAEARIFLKEILASRKLTIRFLLKGIRKSFGKSFRGWRGIAGIICPIDPLSQVLDAALMDSEDEEDLRALVDLYGLNAGDLGIY